MRARLVERLGLSAAAVSETVGRLASTGYAELRDDRSIAPHRQGPRARDHGRAPAPARRAAAGRRDRARVGEGAPRGRPLGARDLGRRRGEARRSCSATRPPARTATRSRAPKRTADVGATVRARPTPSPARCTVPRISEKLELADEGLRLVAAARLIPGAAATVIEQRPDGIGVRTTAGEHTIAASIVAEQLYVTSRTLRSSTDVPVASRRRRRGRC